MTPIITGEIPVLHLWQQAENVNPNFSNPWPQIAAPDGGGPAVCRPPVKYNLSNGSALWDVLVTALAVGDQD